MIIDRVTVYTGENPRSTDTLQLQQNAMAALGLMIQDLLGTNTWVAGAGATGNLNYTASIAPGRIYQQAALEATQWSGLPSNSTLIMKQGINLSAVVVPNLTPPTTHPTLTYASAYLIQAQYQDSDTNPLALQFYNATNPLQPFTGEGNNLLALPTIRAGIMALSVVSGGEYLISGGAPTINPTSGWVPLYNVSVPYGYPNTGYPMVITANAAFPATSGTFQLTVGGGTGGPVTAYYSVVNGLVNITLAPSAVTSTGTSFTLGGLPAFLQPASGLPSQQFSVLAQNNSASVNGATVNVQSGNSSLVFSLTGNTAGWTASGTKEAYGSFAYRLA